MSCGLRFGCFRGPGFGLRSLEQFPELGGPYKGGNIRIYRIM